MKSIKKLASAMIILTLSATAVAFPAEAKTFSDVPQSHWAYSVIDEASDDGIMNGKAAGVFAPNATLTRAEYATMLYNLAPESDVMKLVHGSTADNGLYDVDGNAWYADTVSWAVARGVFKNNGGSFSPNRTITREEMAVATYEFLHKYCDGKFVLDSIYKGFTDDAAFSSSANRDKVYILVNNGIIAGKSDGSFDPQGSLTRAEAAAMAVRVADIVASEAPADTLEMSAEAALASGSAQITSDEKTFIDLLNNERASVGVHQLKVSPLLMEAAEIRAREVVEKCASITYDEFCSYDSSFFHARLDGSRAYTVLDDVMDNSTTLLSSRISYGENLARRRGTKPFSPQEGFNCLMTSQAHVDNMLDSMYDYVGVAHYSDGQHAVWVQVFARAH